MIDLIPVDMELGKKGGEPPGLEGHNVDHIALKIYPFEEEKNGLAHFKNLLDENVKKGWEKYNGSWNFIKS